MSWRLRRASADILGRLAMPGLRKNRCRPALGLILAYHRIGTPGDSLLDHGLWNASADQFAQQIRWIREHADLIPLSQMSSALEGGNGRYVALTFDDGYRDNYDTAFTVLRNLGATATFFVSTGLVDNPRTPWWDELAWIINATRSPTVVIPGHNQPLAVSGHRGRLIRTVQTAAKRHPGGRLDEFVADVAASACTGRIPDELRPTWLTWNLIREMRQGGMEIGGHTVNHPVLSQLDAQAQRWELCESFNRIRSELGEAPKTMSYPVGGSDAYDQTTKREAEAAGWEMACHYGGGHLEGRIVDRYTVPRVAIEPYTRTTDLAAALAWPRWFAGQGDGSPNQA